MSELALYPVGLFFVLSAAHFARSRINPRAAARHTCYGTALLGAALLVLAPPTVRAVQDAGVPVLAIAAIVLGDALRDGAAAAIRLLALALRTTEPVPGHRLPGGPVRDEPLRREPLRREPLRGEALRGEALRGGPLRGEPARRAVRSRLALLGVVLGLRVVLIAVAAPRLSGDSLTVAPALSARLALAGYTAVGMVHTALCLTALLRELVRRARTAGPGRLGTGLRLLTGGLAAGLLWNAWSVDDVLRAATTGSQDGPEDTLCAVLGALCAALIAAGLGSTLWPAVSEAVRGWLRAHRRYRALAPLWRDLHTVLPEIALDPARRLPLPPRDPQFALYRRIIEIHDARLILRQHLDPRASEWLELATRRFPPSSSHAAATAEAAALAAALERAAAGAGPHPADPSVAATGAVAEADPPRALDGEADHLAHLARVYATCPAVAEVRTRARARARADERARAEGALR
ncbi:MAB_1171c family putative transporter [Kitasatospora sp. NPDC058190]|uniref:MAB_1171c family putative transporter n=1 Tax=Kitasatospora sp. NPDC058190 TaxID=3346371 RepID=UPI0036D8639E